MPRPRLLPDRPELGWTPYLWLVYLGFLFFDPVLRGAGAMEWAATLLAVAAFVPLYLRSFWLQGRRQLAVIAGMTLLGALFLPINSGASVFFIYAAGACGYAGTQRLAVRYVAAVLAVLVLEAWWLDVPAWGWGPGIVFGLIVGAANVHDAEVARTRRRLQLAEEEVARLARLAERERIARDLHDLLGHTLSLITLEAELAGRLVERDPVAARREIREVERISREALAEVRRAVRGYRGDGSLAVELSHARLALSAAGVELEDEVATQALPAAVEGCLALALREAVTNVVRHSGARRCRVALWRQGGEVVLEASDDGRGGMAIEGAGLTGMRERAAALGGRLERRGEGGTSLRLVLPLTGEDALEAAAAAPAAASLVAGPAS